MTPQNIKILTAKEYSKVNGEIDEPLNIEQQWKARPDTNEADIEVAKRLGLHIDKGSPKTGDYVGLVWWPGHKGEKALCVTPKFKDMNYMAMYLECLQDPVVAPHMDKCFFFWPEKPLIEITESPLDFDSAPFAAMAFVKELHEMVRRNMRKNFIRKEENLTGRFKGRLLMGQHIRKNLLAGRPDRNYCQYGTISEDCRENQILYAALERCSRKLMADEHVKKNAALMGMIRTCRAALQGVTLRRYIHKRDFSGIRYTGTFVSYKRPHALAKMVLNHQELDPSYHQHESNGNDTIKVVPFALCTSELFERYCEVKLRSIPNLTTWDGNVNLGKKHPYRPDFLCVKKPNADAKITPWILDAKYYRCYQEDNREITEENIQQLLKYSQHKPVREKLISLGSNENLNHLSLAILYPSLSGEGFNFEMKQEEDYSEFILPLGFIPVHVPTVHSGND